MDLIQGPVPSDQPLAMRALAGAAAVLLMLGLIGAVVVDDDADTVEAVAGTTTTLAGQAPPAGELGAPVTSAPGEAVPGAPAPGTPAPTAAPAPAPGGGGSASAQPGKLTPPRPGLYRYNLKEDGEEKRSELRITADGGSAQEPQFRYRESADGNSTESVTIWRANGVFEASRDFPGGSGESSRCDWEPDVLLAPKPLGATSTWSWDSRCKAAIQGQEADFHFTGTAKVTKAERASAGGQGVATWRIESSGRIEITGMAGTQPFTVIVDIQSVDLLSPDRGVIVKSDTKTTVTPPGGSKQESTTVKELQNLDPA